MKMTMAKRLTAMFLCLCLCLSLATPALAAQEDEWTITRVDDSEVASGKTEMEVLEQEQAPFADTDMVRVSIVLAGKTGLETAALSDSRLTAYTDALVQKQEKLEQTISRQVLGGKKLDVVWNLTLSANIISANVPYGTIDEIEALADVERVLIEPQYTPAVVDTGDALTPNMATSPEMIGTANAYASGYTGAGTRIAVIDTGTDTDHQSFSSEALDYSLAKIAERKGMSAEEYKDSLDLLDEEEIASVLPRLHVAQKMEGVTAKDLYRSSKLPFAFNYVDADLDVTHDIDGSSEHGSHVAGIATANAYIPNGDGTFANALDLTKVQGVAPDAQLITLKVFGKSGGAYSSDYIAAAEDAILLGADSINLSLGSLSAGFSDAALEYESIFKNLKSGDSVITISAGNSSNWAAYGSTGGYLFSDDVSLDTVTSPGSFRESLSVASVDNTGSTRYYFVVDNQIIMYGESLSGMIQTEMRTLAGEQEYILIDGFGTAEDFAAVSELLPGRIVACSRGGGLDFETKADNAAKAGAAALVIYDNQEGGLFLMNLGFYMKTNPVVSVTQEGGNILRQAAEAVCDAEGNVLYYQGKLTVSTYAETVRENPEYYTMSSFSSWGVPGSLELKPEITAPGGSIFSVNGATSDTNAYENMSGTSMAAPQVAGMTALVAQYIREQGLDEQTGLSPRVLAQSLLMSTAVPILEESTGTYYSVLRQGAGLADVGAAVAADSYIMMNSDATASWFDGKVKAELGDDAERTGEYSFSFQVNNLTDETKTYTLDSKLFTQDLFEGQLTEDGETYTFLDTGVTLMNAVTSWEADGRTLAAAENLDGLDFDGDGDVDEADGQAILDLCTGLRENIENAERADLDADGDVDSYDAWLFFTRYSTGALVIPAGGSADVTVSIRLTEAQKAELDASYPTGAYVEGYIFVESVDTDEGIQGTEHAIPMVGFYGDWSEPDMFEEGQYEQYVTGDITDPMYMGDFGTNFLGITFGGNTREVYLFGGNPVISDDTYLPERNAINSENDDALTKFYFSSIRNAAASRFRVINADTGEVLKEQLPGPFYAGYYYSGGGYWMNLRQIHHLGWNPDGLAQDTRVEVALELAPEYFLKADGTVDWDTLGSGTEMRIPLVIDNTTPELDSVALEMMTGVLQVTASDNRYVAGVVLYDGSGERRLAAVGAKQDIQPGEKAVYELPVEGIGGSEFYLQVVDYAHNTATYHIQREISETTDLPKRIVFDLLEYQWYEFDPSDPGNQSLWMEGDSSHVYWGATMVDNMIFALDDYGELRAIDVVENYKNYPVGKTGIALSDLAYNKADGCLYGVHYRSSWGTPNCGDLYRVDMYTAEAEKLGFIGVYATALACDENGTFYCNSHGTGDIYTFTLDTLGEPEKFTEVTDLYSTRVQAMEYDYSTDTLCWSTYSQNMQSASSPTYYIEVDVDQKTYSRYTFENRPQYSALLVPQPGVENGSWADSTDTVTEMIISDTELHMLKGSFHQITTELYPWNLSDRSLTYTTSDPDVAVVDENGVITAVGEGQADITVACPVDPNAVRTCAVTVSSAEVTLKGILKDTDGENKLFTWTLGKEETWTPGQTIDTDFMAATYNPDQDVFYVMEDTVNQWDIHVVDAQTGKTIEVYENTFDGYLNDMVYSEYYSTQEKPKIFAVADSAVLGFSSPDNWQQEGYSLYSYFAYYGAEYLIAVASGGETDYYGRPGEAIYALDNAGNLWQLIFYVSNNKGYVTYSTFTTNLAELDAWAEFDPNGIGNYSSMVAADDGSLYLSLYNGKTNEIYHLGKAGAREYQASYLTTMGEGVYPASLYAAEAVQEPDGGVQSVNVQSDNTVSEQETTVTLNLTIKDAQGKDAASASGLVSVDYDAESLKLRTVNVHGDYRSVNAEEDGTVVIAYADLEGFGADEYVATLVFDRIGSAEGSFHIYHGQVDNAASGYTEELTLNYEHRKTELRGAKAATCDEDGYTGDLYCADCGKLLQTGTVIPAFCPSAKFVDVSAEAWYHEGVDFVVKEGYMNGMSETTFAPEIAITRGQMVTVLYRMAGSPETNADETFTDVASNAYYAKAVAWAVDAGVVMGYGDGTFRPDAVLLRQDLAVLLYRFAQLEGAETTARADLGGYNDGSAVSAYAVDAMQWAVATGLIRGITDVTLAPGGTANRATAAVILQRYLKA